MSKQIFRTVFYSGLILSLRAFFQKLPKWVQFVFIIATGMIFSSIISLKIYGLVLSDIDLESSVYLKVYKRFLQLFSLLVI